MSAAELMHRLPRHLKMAELRVFVAVFELRSLRKAAAVLHLTQPAVTKTIAGLEQTLGVRLFDRVASGVEPTVHGRSFAARAQAVFEELRRAAQDLAQLSGGIVGSLRVGALPLPAHPFLPAAVSRLLDGHPGVAVTLVEDREAGLLERLRRRDIELAILRPALVDLPDDLQAEPLFEERACVLAARTHPLALRGALQWAELVDQRWVLAPGDCRFQDHVRRSLDRMHLRPPRPAVEAMSTQMQLALVLNARMLAFGMCSASGFAPGGGAIVRLPFELPLAGLATAAVSLKTHEPSPLARRFIGQVQALASVQSTAAPTAAQDARQDTAPVAAAP